MTDTNLRYSAQSDTRSTSLIWTPPFLLFFAALLGLGLGIASLVTHIWLNSGIYSVEQIGMAYSVILMAAWLVVLLYARSWWTRGGAIFGCVWALCMLGQFWLSRHGSSAQDAIIIQMRATANSVLLASVLCLSIARIRLKLWDAILLWSLLLVFCAYLAYSYLKVPAHESSLLFIEGKIISLALYLSVAVWWLRPSCWRDQPGPTFLFGLAPIILFFLIRSGSLNTEQNVFFLQVFFLCLLLGAIRILQGEKQANSKAKVVEDLSVKPVESQDDEDRA
ncbi:hypothetical protein KDA_02530 [Dictyobacter alpinus]|uniref:Uncharacterized protein n=1 Tax=Dictyobacter alpinus TaxID=2014873 RepID=A0A402B095_9CHLR|nr:hypothetical protein [Dictyobacter alpinus]GCE24769.1 hypothetical protein KDA_02530 [Dictyobacter alpinus]